MKLGKVKIMVRYFFLFCVAEISFLVSPMHHPFPPFSICMFFYFESIISNPTIDTFFYFFYISFSIAIALLHIYYDINYYCSSIILFTLLLNHHHKIKIMNKYIRFELKTKSSQVSNFY